MSKLSFSHTAINDFENCPLAFYHKRVLKDVAFVQSEAAKHGDLVHKALEASVKTGQPIAEEYAVYEPLVKVLIAEVAKGRKVETERKFTLNADLKPTDWFAKDAWLRAILDVIVWFDDTSVFIGDYKTSKRVARDFDQLEVAALTIWAHYPEVDAISVGYLWLKHDKLTKATFRRSQCNELWAKHIARIRRIYKAEEVNVWPAKPSGLCSWCDVYKQLGCAYAQIKEIKS